MYYRFLNAVERCLVDFLLEACVAPSLQAFASHVRSGDGPPSSVVPASYCGMGAQVCGPESLMPRRGPEPKP